MTSCRNKIAFCGLSATDAKEFADEFGKDLVTMRQSTYKNRILLPKWFPESYRDTETEEYRFRPTYLQDQMRRFHFICRMLNDGTPQNPIEGVGTFVPRNWRELRQWEPPKEVVNEDKEQQGLSIFTRLLKREPVKKVEESVSLLVVDPQNQSERAYAEDHAVLMGQGKVIEHPEIVPEEIPVVEPQEVLIQIKETEVSQQNESSLEQEPVQPTEQPSIKPKQKIVEAPAWDDNEDDFF